MIFLNDERVHQQFWVLLKHLLSTHDSAIVEVKKKEMQAKDNLSKRLPISLFTINRILHLFYSFIVND